MLLPVVLTLIATQDQDSGFVKYLGNLCYTKWALEAFVIANAERFVVTKFLFPAPPPPPLYVMDAHSLRYALGILVHAIHAKLNIVTGDWAQIRSKPNCFIF